MTSVTGRRFSVVRVFVRQEEEGGKGRGSRRKEEGEGEGRGERGKEEGRRKEKEGETGSGA